MIAWLFKHLAAFLGAIACLVVVGMAYLIIDNQNRMRSLINEIEDLNTSLARLTEENQFLATEQSRAAFAANIAESARALGLADARGDRVVTLPRKALPGAGKEAR